MKKNTTPLLASLSLWGILSAAFMAASRIANGFHSFVGTSSGLSIIEIYLFIIGLSFTLYAIMKGNQERDKMSNDVTNVEERFVKRHNEQYEKITKEYTKELEIKHDLIMAKMETQESAIARVEETLKEIFKHLLDKK